MAVVSVKSLLNKLIDMKLETLRSDDGDGDGNENEWNSFLM